METKNGFEAGLDSHRRESGSATFRTIANFLANTSSPAKKKTENEPIYAALGKELDETIPGAMSDRALTRNRALLHYIATLAVSNSEMDQFNYEFVQSLLDGGANINEAVDVYGQTIFHEVARSWNLDVAAFILKNGANINQPDKYGRSPLHVCAAANHADMVEFLLQRGADIDARSTGDGQTPLHFAAKNDATLSLKALLGFGASIDSLDNTGRPALQVAAELSRAATARMLIEEGASSCIYDNNGSSAMTVLTEKLPYLAVEALDQLHVSDTITRRELFYLNLLEESRLKKETRKARTPLETAVNGRQFDVLMHPVMQRLIQIKWDQYGKFGTMLDLMVNVVYAMLFTVFAVQTPSVGKELYFPLGSKGWRIFLGLVLILINTYMMYLQIRTTINSQRKQKLWIKWRIQQLNNDLEYCHPRWQEEKYVKDEMRNIKGVPLLSTIDAWFVFDWFIIILVLVAIGLNLAYFKNDTNSVKSAYIRVLSVLVILIWIRILKYLRPFPGIGTLVLILGATFGDFVNWGFFFLLLFIPFTASFWIIFGGNSLTEVPSYAVTQRLIYTMIQMSVGEDFDVDGLVAADPVMARLLSALYITVMVIVCLNILIAYLSNTFTSVYSKAVENTSMQRAINVLIIEKFLTKNRKEIYFRFVREHASPEIVSSSAIFEKSETRQVEKNTEQMQKDFKKSHDILTQRFNKQVGKGKIGAFDMLLRDVEKLTTLQDTTRTDLTKIQADLENLGRIMFGASSPVRNFFHVQLKPAKTRASKGSTRVRIESAENEQGSPDIRRLRAASNPARNVTSTSSIELGIHGSEDELDEKTGERKKKISFGDLIPKVSIFKGKERSSKKTKGKIKFADETNDDQQQESDREEDESAFASDSHEQRSSEKAPHSSKDVSQSSTLRPPSPRYGQHSPRQSPRSSPRSRKHGQHSPRPSPHSSRHGQHSPRPSPHPSRDGQRSGRPRIRSPRHGQPSSSEGQRSSGQNSRELVPYNNNQEWDNDGFDEDNEDYRRDNDHWERISADSISL